MTDTGWKHPTMVKQDSSKKINNGLSCYAFVNLNNIKKDDKSYADQQPWPYTGVDTDHKSPVIYAYNYNFQIPSNATVSKITLFALVDQLTHPKYYYEHYVLKRQLRYSTSKFCNVKLKQGVSLNNGGDGNDMSSKCAVQMLPYKAWSTEKTTTFSGTPKEWGITNKDVPSIINSTNFGVAIQFVGTVKNGWCNPGVAQLKLKVEYTVPKLVNTTPCEFTKLVVTYNNREVTFTNGVSGVLCDLTYNDFSNPAIVTFNFYHKGNAGETPVITFSSSSLIMGANEKAYEQKKTYAGKYTIPSQHCGTDKSETVYSQSIAIFPGILYGEQTVQYSWKGTKYALKFNVNSILIDDATKYKFMNRNQQCVIKNCYFSKNIAIGVGGANYVTSEYFLPDGNIYGTGTDANKAKNKNDENDGNACPNTYWLKRCINK